MLTGPQCLPRLSKDKTLKNYLLLSHQPQLVEPLLLPLEVLLLEELPLLRKVSLFSRFNHYIEKKEEKKEEEADVDMGGLFGDDY